MAGKITYYLGAGASKHAIPVVAEFTDRLDTLQGSQIPNWIQQHGDLAFDTIYGKSLGDALEHLRSQFQWLLEESRKFFTIDSLAKKYYLTRKYDELRRLKALLCVYFMLEQIRRPIDPRYDAFWTAVVGNSLQDFIAKSGMSVISWNYDYQIEKSLARFFDLRNYDDLKECLQLLDIDQYGSNFGNGLPPVDKSRFSLIKLNGSAEMFLAGQQLKNIEYYWHHEVVSPERLKSLIHIFNAFSSERGGVDPLLTFAWEKSLISNHVRQQAQLVSEDTEILIVIGYSFPFFNRQIDRDILNSMKKLRHIYIQTTSTSNPGVRERVKSFLPDFGNITLIDDANQFYIPYEY